MHRGRIFINPTEIFLKDLGLLNPIGSGNPISGLLSLKISFI